MGNANKVRSYMKKEEILKMNGRELFNEIEQAKREGRIDTQQGNRIYKFWTNNTISGMVDQVFNQ